MKNIKKKSSRVSKKNSARNSKKNKILFITKPPFFKLFYTSLIINVVSVVGIFFIKNRLPPQLPLFYGLPEGKEQLTSQLGLIIAPFSAMAIVLTNAVISSFLKNKFLRKTLIIVGFAVSLLALVTTAQIILLIGAF